MNTSYLECVSETIFTIDDIYHRTSNKNNNIYTKIVKIIYTRYKHIYDAMPCQFIDLQLSLTKISKISMITELLFQNKMLK